MEKIHLQQRDLKQLSINEMESLANEIRELIIKKVNTIGGHMAPNLGIVETEICYPRSDEEHYTKTKSHIKVICKDFSMLSRTFDVYSDENSDYYIAIDQAYFLKIKDSSIIEKLKTGEKK